MSEREMASDAEITELHYEARSTQASWEANSNREKPNGCWSNTLLLEAPLVVRILNRLTASEERASTAERERDEARRELEWRGLMVKASIKDWHLRVLDLTDGPMLGFGERGCGTSYLFDIDANGLPARPADDATVAEIREAING